MAEAEKQELVDVVGQCPYDYYQATRQRGPVSWEPRTGYWVASTYSSVSQILADEDAFPRLTPAEIVSEERYERIIATPTFLRGQERLQHHRWWLEIFNPKNLQALRAGVIAEVVDATIDEFASRGSAELVHDYTEPVADRAIAAVLGLPWQDESWMAELRTNFNHIEHYKSFIYLTPEESKPFAEQALAATYRIDDLIRPFMDQRRAHPDDTIMSRVLHDDAMADWSDDERYGLVRTFFTGGSGTTSIELGNAIYLMLSTEGMTERLTGADPKVVANFVEEALRLVPTNHYRTRVVQEDVEIGGARLAKGQIVAPLIASGNRDESHYDHADEVDLERKNPRQHLAFSVGIGACAGSGLARVELQEGVARLVNRLGDLRLDPAAEAPSLGGSMFRLYAPLHVLFQAR
ncbi:cytochrome P450 [Dactylosporangium sp. NPDC051484]|uniref:cytochrome P450 n=1 Tax=Dactylosporangium sp. NPDC051484 TaxID=3154942 RepID=UPI00344BD15D